MREQLNSTLLSVIELRKVKSKIFCKPNNLRKSTPRMQLIFISAINIESSKYFASRTFTKVLYLIIICFSRRIFKIAIIYFNFWFIRFNKITVYNRNIGAHINLNNKSLSFTSPLRLEQKSLKLFFILFILKEHWLISQLINMIMNRKNIIYL